MYSLSTLAAVALGLGSALASAQAVQTPQLQRAQAQARQLGQAEPGTRAVDNQPPVVTAFATGRSVNVRKVGERLPIDISISDNNAGVAYVYVEARGPSGQAVMAEKRFDFPMRKAQVGLGMNLGELTQAGSWQVTYLYAYDLAGNVVTMGQSALDALGNTRFNVKNTVYDVTPPTLLRGRILTPTFSASSPSPGVPADGERQGAGLVLATADGGGPDNAGVSSATATFCQMSEWGYCSQSFSVQADNHGGRPGEATSTLVLGGLNRYYGGEPSPGTHRLMWVSLTDFAGNSRSYQSTETGGETDFSTMFPSTTIEVLP